MGVTTWLLRKWRRRDMIVRETVCRIRKHRPVYHDDFRYCGRCADALPDWPNGQRTIG
jgi:hypothetical protein